MDLQVIFSAGVMVFLVIFLAMLWVIYRGMKKFLREDIEEALIVSGDSVVEQIAALDKSLTRRINVLHNENKALREELTRQMSEVTAIIKDSNSKAELGANSIVKELNYIVPALRDEVSRLLETLSKNAGAFQKTTLENFEAEIKKFINVMDSACKNLNKAADDQSKLLANMAGTLQNVLVNGEKDIQSEFHKAHSAIKTTIDEAVKQIDSDYQENMRRMFQAMADNLAAITQQLRTSAIPSPAKGGPKS